MKLGKWIGGIMGFIAMGGPLGALAGYVLGSLFDKATEAQNSFDTTNGDTQTNTGQRNSFLFSMLVMASYIIRADGRIMHSEMEFVRRFLRTNFGEEAVNEGQQILLNLFEEQKRMDATNPYAFRTPETNVDPGMPGDLTGKTYQIEAYLSDGTFLWSKDLGQGIEPGIWYSPYVVYDFNGDGKAEVALKTAPDNVQRDEKGRVDSGDEYLTVLDGMTGEEIAHVDWPKRNDRYGNLVRRNRNQIGMAFLDGKTPCILACRGTYKLMTVEAWQLNKDKLDPVWKWDGDEENPVVRSMGSHNMVCGDVDEDGREEILLGSCMLDDNGTLLWSAGLGHPDKVYLTDIHPERPGMEVFLCLEPWHDNGRGVCMVDARSGEPVWNIGYKTFHVSDGMVADIDASHKGLECFAKEDRKGGSTDQYLLAADGTYLSRNKDVPSCRNWAWWDADLLRETFAGDDNRWGASSSSNGKALSIVKWKGAELTHGIEGDILMIADLYGDWREEIVTALDGEIRIYTTNIPARDRRVTLMQDPVYRSYIAHRSMGYPQSPVPSYYLGE